MTARSMRGAPTVAMTLTDFLLSRIVEDEVWARWAKDASDDSPWSHGSDELRCDVFTRAGLRVVETRSANLARHVARHDPARVLAECEAKRALLAIHSIYDGDGLGRCGACADTYSVTPWDGLCEVAKPLAAVYADHPDYDEAWRP